MAYVTLRIISPRSSIFIRTIYTERFSLTQLIELERIRYPRSRVLRKSPALSRALALQIEFAKTLEVRGIRPRDIIDMN